MRLTEYVHNRGRPELLLQWDEERNRALSPEQASSGSDTKVWWKCSQGHRWQARINSRTLQGRGCPYCAGQLVLPGETDLAARYPEIASQWHPTRNSVPPSQVLPHTHKRYWWQCEQGHEWQVSPSVLIQGSGCPYCAGKKVIPGESDLVTLQPDLAAQWHPDKNGTLTPAQVGVGSMSRVWWLCEFGHDYQTPVYSRVQGCGCPYCAGKKVWPGFNDLATLFPHLSAEWHPTLNGALTPRDVTRGSHKSVWWECRDGHVWKAAIFSRTRAKPSNCPVCAGKVKMKKTV